MQLTETWKNSFPSDITSSFKFAETRDASAILQATDPDAFNDIITALRDFHLNPDTLFRPGGNRSIIAERLDESFRQLGWREAKYSQKLTTSLKVFPWNKSTNKEVAHSFDLVSEAEGHKIDNVKGRAVVDIEWNPKDGNLDRDLANYIALYQGGIINVGILIIRSSDVSGHACDLIADINEIAGTVPAEEVTTSWLYRLDKTPKNPYGTTTTANFEKLEPRLKRGDGQGCPILAIGLSNDRYVQPVGSLADEVLRLARSTEPRVPRDKQAQYEEQLKEMLRDSTTTHDQSVPPTSQE